MSAIKNAAPYARLLGIKDESGRTVTAEAEALPIHLPHVFIYGERGPLEPQVVFGSSLTKTYGVNSLDYRKKFANHQTVLLNTLNENANQVMVQRLVPTDIKPKARIALCLELLPTKVKLYDRNADGSYKLDTSGNPIETGTTTDGYKGRWFLDAVTGTFGATATRAGTMTDTDNNESVIYPIIDLEVAHYGSYGNGLGMRLWAPTALSTVAVNEKVVEDQLAQLYRLQFVEKADDNVTNNVKQTLAGEQYVEFSFKEGAIDRFVDMDIHFDTAVIPAYQDLETPGQTPVWGPFGKAYLYQANIETILGLIYTKEKAFGLISQADGAEHLINLCSGIDYNGIPHYAYTVATTAESGLLMSENTTHYATGADDGTMSDAAFDLLVRNQMKNYGDLDYPFLDDAMYPHTCFYDTGFSIDTKKALLTPLGLRKDVYVVLSTQDISDDQNTIAEESSMAIALRAAARMYPESEIYGTKTCRALVVGHSGYLINSKYKGLLPLTIEIAAKCANYMGASNGQFKPGLGFDMNPYNQITMFRNVNCTFKKAEVRNKDWDNGLVWVQRYDRQSLFIPAVQTVYDDDTSIINSAINMMIAVELQKVSQRVWRDLTGISSLTADQFIERSDRLINERTKDRFDNRVIIKPETYYTDADTARGYSWSTKIHMYGNNMKTVGTMTVVPHRMEDYE